MSSVRRFIVAASLVLAFHVLAGEAHGAVRKFRMRFIAAGFTNRADSLDNSQLISLSSQAALDIIWDIDAVDGKFPIVLPAPASISGSGTTVQVADPETKSCRGDFTPSSVESVRQSAGEVYNVGDEKVAIRIFQPLESKILEVLGGVGPCAGPYAAIFFGSQIKANPTYESLPSEPGTQNPLDPFTYAAVQVSMKDPEISKTFTYEARGTAPGEVLDVVWFGTLTIEKDPKGPASTVDPFTMFGYSPPTFGAAPPPPPDIPPSTTVAENKGWTLRPINDDLKNIFNIIRAILAAVTPGGAFSLSALPPAVTGTAADGSAFSYNTSTGELTISGLSGAPTFGSLTFGFKSLKPKESAKSVKPKGSGLPVTTSSNTISIPLPKVVQRALKSKAATRIGVATKFTPTLGKSVATVNAVINLKKIKGRKRG